MMTTIRTAIADHARGFARRFAVLAVALSLLAIPLSGGISTADAAADSHSAEATHEGECPFSY